MRTRSFFSALLLALPLLVHAQAEAWAWDDGTTPYVQSPSDIVDRMLRLADPKKDDILLDLGSGDGRIVIEAAKRFGTRGLGVDIEPRLVALAQRNAEKAGMQDLAKFAVRDLFETDFSQATIVTAYLLPEVNLKIMPKLLAMKPGTRIVTHDYDFGPWPYDEMVELPLAEKLVGPLGRSKAFLFIVPANARGRWRAELPEHGGHWDLAIKQEFQVLDVTARVAGREQQVRGTRLRGEEIRMVITGIIGSSARNQLIRAHITGDRMEGEMTISDGEDYRTVPFSARRLP